MAPTQKHRWLTLPDTSREGRRNAALVRFVLGVARADFDRRYPGPRTWVRWSP